MVPQWAVLEGGSRSLFSPGQERIPYQPRVSKNLDPRQALLTFSFSYSLILSLSFLSPLPHVSACFAYVGVSAPLACPRGDCEGQKRALDSVRSEMGYRWL